MKLYFFDAGHVSLKVSRKGYSVMFDLPISFFLIKHPKGNVLFDTGCSMSLIKNYKKYLSPQYGDMRVSVSKKQYILNQLQIISLDKEDIDYVVFSHLHWDHCGGAGIFPKAEYILQREELNWARNPDDCQRHAYIPNDFDKKVHWSLLEGHKRDIFNDGSLIITPTPGHTPGHQSLLVKLKNSGRYFLSGDSCYTEKDLQNVTVPSIVSDVVWSSSESIKSIRKIRRLQSETGATVVFGHDPLIWPEYKKAPEYYE